jgi:Flp pilus assembly protein TadD
MRVSKHFTGTCVVAVAALVAACGGSSSGSSSSTGGSSPNAKPITIGTSLSLSGDFAADGQAFERGYSCGPTTRTPRAACSGTRSSCR